MGKRKTPKHPTCKHCGQPNDMSIRQFCWTCLPFNHKDNPTEYMKAYRLVYYASDINRGATCIDCGIPVSVFKERCGTCVTARRTARRCPLLKRRDTSKDSQPAWVTRCKTCGTRFTKCRTNNLFCSPRCLRLDENHKRQAKRRNNKAAPNRKPRQREVIYKWMNRPYRRDCRQCGQQFIAPRNSRRRHCSDECIAIRNARHYGLKRDGQTGSRQEAIVALREYLHLRDNGRCSICGRKVNMDANANRLKPSIDHIIPRSLGGSDELHNLAIAHMGCNTAKGARPSNDQLRLIG